MIQAFFAIESVKNANSLVLRASFDLPECKKSSKNADSIVASACFDYSRFEKCKHSRAPGQFWGERIPKIATVS